ncbi:SdpI family protein [Myroides sp. WP-1]|uniref:SdpI family protein n=1 Tax=Myroides sp. WP-1 TaxID=2759944 RepID=UPI0015F98720|nr:SdpI family protein [Myroides sp. WP-1]MBB1139333.1 SdpI family protein [Myroides sp. WP-1]
MSDNTFFYYLLLPAIYIIIGLLMPHCKNIGPVGYRTPRSMKNQENWDFSQKLSGRLMLSLGILTLVSNLLFYFAIFPRTYYKPTEMIFVAGGSILVIIYTEIRLYQFEKK